MQFEKTTSAGKRRSRVLPRRIADRRSRRAPLETSSHDEDPIGPCGPDADGIELVRPAADHDDPLLRFRTFLRSRGLPLTAQREQIVRSAFSIRDHFSIEDLAGVLRKRRIRVGLATVYRTVGLMEAGRIVRGHDFGGGFRVYERTAARGHHDHLICEKCGQLIEFVAQEIERIQEEIADRSRFHARSHRLEIYGLCRECSGGEKA